jgi:predicted DNA-binding transcriptional regulator AlpA
MSNIPPDGATATDDALLPQDEAARRLGLGNPRTLAAWRLRRRGPPYVRLGRAVRYRAADIAAFVAARLVPA